MLYTHCLTFSILVEDCSIFPSITGYILKINCLKIPRLVCHTDIDRYIDINLIWLNFIFKKSLLFRILLMLLLLVMIVNWFKITKRKRWPYSELAWRKFQKIVIFKKWEKYILLESCCRNSAVENKTNIQLKVIFHYTYWYFHCLQKIYLCLIHNK